MESNTVNQYHVPVLLEESVGGLHIRPNGIYVDVTFGGGGHSRLILSQLNANGHLYSFDQDADAARNMQQGEQAIFQQDNFTFIQSNFRYLKNWMRYYGVEQIDGLLADLGMSSHHLDDETRGFSFRYDAPLDMRMNTHASTTASDIINTYSESDLADIFYLYGELKNARRIASVLVKARSQRTIHTTQDLLSLIEPLFHQEREKKYLARLFQALRIAVNHEMEVLQEMLMGATDLLKPGGYLSVITYHSLEDRIVKNIMRSGRIDGKVNQDFFGRTDSPYKIVNTKVITPAQDEQTENPRSRSAKLRIAQRK